MSSIARVCHLTSAHNRRDHRIFFKECRSLADAGYETHLVVADGLGSELVDGVSIHDLGVFRGRLQRFTKGPLEFYSFVRRIDADIYHFHDPDLLPAGLLLHVSGHRVIYDVHENYAAQILVKDYIRPKWFRSVLGGLFSLVERVVSSRLDAVVTVTPAMERRFTHPLTKLVRNVPDMAEEGPTSVASLSGDDDPLTVVYAGSLSFTRGILDLVEAVHKSSGKIRLRLLGDWHSSGLRQQCEAHPGWVHCEYLGRVPHDQVAGVLRTAHIGVHMVHDLPRTRGSLPTKVLEYFAVGLPCLLSDTPEHREFFGDLVYYAEPGSPDAIAEQLSTFHGDEEDRSSKAARAYQFVKTQANWQVEVKNLLNLYSVMLPQ